MCGRSAILRMLRLLQKSFRKGAWLVVSGTSARRGAGWVVCRLSIVVPWRTYIFFYNILISLISVVLSAFAIPIRDSEACSEGIFVFLLRFASRLARLSLCSRTAKAKGRSPVRGRAPTALSESSGLRWTVNARQPARGDFSAPFRCAARVASTLHLQ